MGIANSPMFRTGIPVRNVLFSKPQIVAIFLKGYTMNESPMPEPSVPPPPPPYGPMPYGPPPYGPTPYGLPPVGYPIPPIKTSFAEKMKQLWSKSSCLVRGGLGCGTLLVCVLCLSLATAIASSSSNTTQTSSTMVLAYRTSVSSNVDAMMTDLHAAEVSCDAENVTLCATDLQTVHQMAQDWLDGLQAETPPACYATVHAYLIAGAQLLADGSNIAITGINSLDTAMLASANDLFVQSATAFQRATTALHTAQC